MPSLPKPPKLYYYIAGLTVFIIVIIFGVRYISGIELPSPAELSQTEIESIKQSKAGNLTSNPEPAKTSDEANIKPKGENLTSASFDADPNTDVIVFEECNITLKIQNLTPVKIFKNTYKDRASNIETYEIKIRQGKSVSDNKSESFECSLGEIRKDIELGFTSEYPSLLGSIANNSGVKIESNNSDQASNFYFSKNNIFYRYRPITKDCNCYNKLLTSVKFGLETNPKYNILPLVDISDWGELDIPDIKEFLKEKKEGITDIDITCDTYPNKCYIFDQNNKPIADLSSIDSDIGPRWYRGKKGDKNVRYIYKKVGTDYCGYFITVYEFNFKEGFLKPVSDLNGKSCPGIGAIVSSQFNDNFVDFGNCYDEIFTIIKPKECFKKDSDYQTYLKAYNEEQAQNKAAEAELAKYLE